MEWVTTKLVDKLIKEKIIEEAENELYVFAFVTRVEQLSVMLIIGVIAIKFQVLFQTLVFGVFFHSLRTHAGGYHTNTYTRCFIGSIVIFLIFVCIGYPFLITNISIMYGLLIVSILVLEIIGAVNHPNVGWNQKEYSTSKRITRITVVIETAIISVVDLLGGNKSYVVFMSFGIILSALLLFVGKYLRMEVRV